MNENIGNKIDEYAVNCETEDTKEYVETNNNEIILYIITDKNMHGLLNYMRENGLNVSRIFDNIEDVRVALMLQDKPVRVIILDSGTGKLLTTIIRKELVDLIGISDEYNKFTVFYTDSMLKSSILNGVSKNNFQIDWFKYINTATAVATMLNYSENYSLDESFDMQTEIDTDSLLEQSVEKIDSTNERMSFTEFTQIYHELSKESYKELPKFKPHL